VQPDDRKLINLNRHKPLHSESREDISMPGTIFELGGCNMRRRFLLTALLAIGSAALFTGNAVAGGCGRCGYYAPTAVVFRYTVQPQLIVRHPVVVVEPYYLNEYVPCGNGYVVNQGQYHSDAALIAERRCFHPRARVWHSPCCHTRYIPAVRPCDAARLQRSSCHWRRAGIAWHRAHRYGRYHYRTYYR
jgi:hypothetical protein